MKLTILGCSGGIGSGRHTTCFLLDDDILIDAGTGMTRLSLEQLARIDHVFLTHCHLDHVLGLPLLIDAVGERRKRPLTVHALPETLDILSDHLFNWKLWPDFREIPDAENPWMKFSPLPLGSSIVLGERRLTTLPAHHVVPACGYRVTGKSGSLVFTGDTTSSEVLVHAINDMSDLNALIIETSFENSLRDIAVASKHHWPDSLATELSKLKTKPRIWITHLKPGNEERIMAELKQRMTGRDIQMLFPDQIIEW